MCATAAVGHMADEYEQRVGADVTYFCFKHFIKVRGSGDVFLIVSDLLVNMHLVRPDASCCFPAVRAGGTAQAVPAVHEHHGEFFLNSCGFASVVWVSSFATQWLPFGFPQRLSLCCAATLVPEVQPVVLLAATGGRGTRALASGPSHGVRAPLHSGGTVRVRGEDEDDEVVLRVHGVPDEGPALGAQQVLGHGQERGQAPVPDLRAGGQEVGKCFGTI